MILQHETLRKNKRMANRIKYVTCVAHDEDEKLLSGTLIWLFYNLACFHIILLNVDMNYI